jgi:NAD(P)H-dependent FMN reductase
MTTPKIAVVLGSARPGRRGAAVADWVLAQAAGREGATYELLDVASFDLDLLDDPVVPGAANRQYASDKTRAWSRAVDSYDAYVWVTAEYNHGVPAAFKNALDVLYPEWNNKAVAFVSYGADNGVRAVEHWRAIVANVKMADVRAQLALSTFFDFDDAVFAPAERRVGEVAELFNQLEAMAVLCQQLRA